MIGFLVVTPTTLVFESYQKLLNRVDELAGTLFARHRPHLRCRRGCYYCCTRISVTPLEYAWVSAALSERRRTGASTRPLGTDTDTPRIPAHDSFINTIPADSELAEARTTPRCALLRDGVCSMYSARPVICRLHGLPLAYPVFEYDERGLRVGVEDPEVALVWCDLNFTNVNVSASMREDDIVRMADVHAQLEELNRQFLDTEAGAAFGGVTQIDLDSVVELTPGAPGAPARRIPARGRRGGRR